MAARWEELTMPGGTSIDWGCIAYSPALGLYVAVSDGVDPDYDPTDIYATSTDGTNWIQRQLPVSGSWGCIIWAGSFFCAVEFNGQAVVSSDGLTWTPSDTGNGQLSTVLWNGSRLLTWNGGAGTYLVYSYSDDAGLTWTMDAFTLPAGFDFILYGACNGALFCLMCCVGTSNNKCLTSPDGITWTARNMPVAGDWRKIVWNGYTFLAAADNSNNAAVSSDGITWEARTLPLVTRWSSMVWNGYHFFLFTYYYDTVAISHDSVIWDVEPLPGAGAYWYAATAGPGQKTIILAGALDAVQGVYRAGFWTGELECVES